MANDPNLLDKWTVDAGLLAFRNGEAAVEIIPTHAQFGPWAPLTIALDWHGGMEAPDIEAEALKHFAHSLVGLAQACIDEAKRRSGED